MLITNALTLIYKYIIVVFNLTVKLVFEYPISNTEYPMMKEKKFDFLHKLKIALKELRETDVWLKIIVKAELIKPAAKLNALLKETNELISILFKSIDIAKKGN